MVEIENINYLRKHFPELRHITKDISKRDKVEVIFSKKGSPTLTIERDERIVYLHSKYDPIHEAEKLVERYSKDLSEKEHVFFYGIGLGYHVEEIAKKFPHLTMTLFEPNIDIFNSLLKTISIKKLTDKAIKQMVVKTSVQERDQFLNNFANGLDKEILLIPLPSYERVFKEEYDNFIEVFAKYVKSKRFNLRTNSAFEKRWTINSLMNFKSVINTPNILNKENKLLFKNKPAIIVAAGPSLNEELENLRNIKENGLAYIFSVGSAINTLVEYGVYPDAACTYDPQSHNHIVFEKAIKKEVDREIPLIFGTSVGYETLDKYKGLKAHMVTTQDTVSPYFLKTDNKYNSNKVSDAPSIAVVTTELLNKLECNPIIFVGQNLAYLNNSRYSKGIKYKGRSNEIPQEALDKSLTVENVKGEFVLTNDGFMSMKLQMEKVILAFKDIRNCTFINTTQGGAKIEGTYFESLQEVIEQRLSEKKIITNWYEELSKPFVYNGINHQKNKMDKSLKQFLKLLDNLIRILKQIKQKSLQSPTQLLSNLFTEFDKLYKELTLLDFYNVFILPMSRVQNELVVKQVNEFRFEQNTVRKGEKIVRAFSNYFNHIKQDIEMIVPIYNNVMVEIEQESEEI